MLQKHYFSSKFYHPKSEKKKKVEGERLITVSQNLSNWFSINSKQHIVFYPVFFTKLYAQRYNDHSQRSLLRTINKTKKRTNKIITKVNNLVHLIETTSFSSFTSLGLKIYYYILTFPLMHLLLQPCS